jgi:hypothetical protein
MNVEIKDSFYCAVLQTLMFIIFIFLLVSQYPDIVSKLPNSFVETIIIE